MSLPKLKNASYTTVTATGSVDGTFDVYLITASAAVTVTLPAASSQLLGRSLIFRRTDTTNFAVTIQRAGSDTLTLTNNASATSTTITASDVLVLTTTSLTNWTLTQDRPTFKTFTVTADAPVTVTTNYDLWIAPTLGADRAFTLPLAASVGVGKTIEFSNSSAANNIVLTRSGADTINAAATTFNVAADTGRKITSDGVSKWYVS